MKKPFISPKLDIIHIKNGDVIMNSHGFGCAGENESCSETCHYCTGYCDADVWNAS